MKITLMFSFIDSHTSTTIYKSWVLQPLFLTGLILCRFRFRSVDINNGGLCVFKFNKEGEAMLQALNMTAHMYTDHVYHY